MSLNKTIKKSFFANLKQELKNSKEELMRASQNFAELSEAYDMLMVDPDLIDSDNMMYLLGYQSPLRIIADYYKNTLLDYVNFTDAIEEIFNDNELQDKYSNLYSNGVELNKELTGSVQNKKSSIFFNYGDKIIEIEESESKLPSEIMDKISTEE